MSPYTPYKLNRLEREMRNLRRWQYVGSAVIALSLGLLFANWIIGARAHQDAQDAQAVRQMFHAIRSADR
jgi:cytochrome bd-type quinol oxidase subunit 2